LPASYGLLIRSLIQSSSRGSSTGCFRAVRRGISSRSSLSRGPHVVELLLNRLLRSVVFCAASSVVLAESTRAWRASRLCRAFVSCVRVGVCVVRWRAFAPSAAAGPDRVYFLLIILLLIVSGDVPAAGGFQWAECRSHDVGTLPQRTFLRPSASVCGAVPPPTSSCRGRVALAVRFSSLGRFSSRSCLVAAAARSVPLFWIQERFLEGSPICRAVFAERTRWSGARGS